MPKYCEYCREYEEDTPLKTCSGCYKVKYCNRKCQLEDWALHKWECDFTKNKLPARKLRRLIKKKEIENKKKIVIDDDVLLVI